MVEINWDWLRLFGIGCNRLLGLVTNHWLGLVVGKDYLSSRILGLEESYLQAGRSKNTKCNNFIVKTILKKSSQFCKPNVCLMPFKNDSSANDDLCCQGK